MTDAPLKPCKPSCQTCLWSETYKAWMSEIDGFLGIVAWDFCPFCGRELLSGGESVDRAEAAEAERDALKQQVADYDANRTLLLAELAAAQDRAHYAATERDAMAARLEWFRLSMVWVPATVPVYKSRVGRVQPAAEFYANLAAAVAAEKDGGDGA